MSPDNVKYCLQTLSSFEPEDIEQDTFEIAVNDDQFAEMSVVRTAELALDLLCMLENKNSSTLYIETKEKLEELEDELYKVRDSLRKVVHYGTQYLNVNDIPDEEGQAHCESCFNAALLLATKTLKE